MGIPFWVASFLCVLSALGAAAFFVRLRKAEDAARERGAARQEAKTQLQEAETRLRDAETLLAQVINGAPMAYAVVFDDLVRESNLHARERLGMQPGSYIEQFFVDVSQARRLRDRLARERVIPRADVSFRAADGNARRHALSLALNEDEHTVILWAMDIEDEELRNDAVRNSQRDLMRLISALPMAMILQNPVTKDIEFYNAAFGRLLGLPPDGAESGVNERGLLSPAQKDGVSALAKENRLIAAIQESQVTFAAEYTYLAGDGREVDALVSAAEITYRGRRRVVKIVQDIGAEKLRTQMLERAAESEREANQLKGRFLANMSHEIRTPMNAIIGLSQVALLSGQDARNADTYRKINLSAQNLLTIINDILDFSKMEAQKLELTEDVFTLEDIVANAFMVASARIEEKLVELLLDMEPGLPAQLVGDKTRLWQILKNLLDNAAKYTEAGRVVLRVRAQGRKDGKLQLAFTVADTGIGMTPEQTAALGEPFSQFAYEQKYRTTGTGLGMSIVKQLLGLMGGSFHIESEPRRGTNITVTIGFGTPDNAKAAPPLRLPEGYPVLVADDDPVSREILACMLSSAGCAPTCVSNGTEALAEARKRPPGQPFRVVILDYLLGGGEDGVAVARRLAPYAAETTLLMVSAYVRRIPEAEARGAGIRDILQKPLQPSVFLNRLAETLNAGPKASVPSKPVFSGGRVLLCEDNPTNQEVAVQMLELLGIRPDVAENGKEGLERLEQKEYDLVLMDILMPVMDGREATAAIRHSDKPYRDIRILAMTANVMREQVEEFAAMGFNGHIPKPISFDELREKLRENLPEGTLLREPEPAGPGAADFAVPGIAVDEGLARFGGKLDRYKSALLRFAKDDAPPPPLAADKAFHLYIHTQKGLTGNLGMNELSALSKAVERGVLDGAPDEEAYRVFRAELAALKARILSCADDGEPAENVSRKTGGKERLKQELEALRDALWKGNATDAESLLASISGTVWEGVPPLDLGPLRAALDEYDFDEAVGCVKELMAAN